MLLPTLYSFRRCPYAIRARMALRAAGIEVDIREVALRDKPPALLAISPKGTVPVLTLANGEVLEQSLDIMRWALLQSDPQGWLSSDTAEMNRWIDLNDVTFKPLLDRYKYANRYLELSMEEHRERALDAFIRPLNTQLTIKDTFNGYLFGERPSLADVALVPFVRQFAAVDKPWFDSLPLPAVQAWLARWLASEDLMTIVAK